MFPNLIKMMEIAAKYMNEDALPPDPIMAAADIPAFGAVGSKPAMGATANATVAAEKAAEAGLLATYSSRAADAAAANAASADEATADALAAKLGSIYSSYSHSMAMSLNR